jgi:hypothetical protein
MTPVQMAEPERGHGAVEEVIVTARRVRENQQDTPGFNGSFATLPAVPNIPDPRVPTIFRRPGPFTTTALHPCVVSLRSGQLIECHLQPDADTDSDNNIVDTKSWAVFTPWTFNITERLSVTGGWCALHARQQGFVSGSEIDYAAPGIKRVPMQRYWDTSMSYGSACTSRRSMQTTRTCRSPIADPRRPQSRLSSPTPARHTTKGAEAELTWAPTVNRTLEASVGHLESSIDRLDINP